MTSIKEHERILQREWLERSIANKDGDNLVEDGLLFRGSIFYEGGFWHRNEGNEQSLWSESRTRLMILTKELNDINGWDIRQETGRSNSTFNYNNVVTYYKNLIMWTFGLLNMQNGRCPDFEIARNMKISGPFYEQAPLVRINCKKQCGGSVSPDTVLAVYMERYADLLKRQIDLYDANLILSCGVRGGRNLITDFIRAFCLPDLKYVPNTGETACYSPSTGKILLDTYSPNSRVSFESSYATLTKIYESVVRYVKSIMEGTKASGK